MLRKQNEAFIVEIQRQEAQQVADEAQRIARFNAEIDDLQKRIDEQRRKRDLEYEARSIEREKERQKRLTERKGRRQQIEAMSDSWLEFFSNLADTLMNGQNQQKNDKSE